MAKALVPGSTIGILGAGQLGRMLAMAAARLGFKCRIYSDVAGPASDVALSTIVAPFDDVEKLRAFAATVDVVTLEFENVPTAAVDAVASVVPVRPGAKALAITQDRVLEKQLARTIGAETAQFATIDTLVELQAALGGDVQPPAILKTRRFGYDGKGQVRISDARDAAAAWDAIKGQPAILEKIVPFAFEVSVIAARGVDGVFAAYDLPENVHRNQILDTSTVPSRLGKKAQIEAQAIARKIGDALDYVGVFAVEFFVVEGPDGYRLRVNEIAPRVHNSGHWTIEACAINQFENQIRAVAGWPLGSTARHADAVMTNLIGHDVESWEALARKANTGLHLYGKNSARVGRKMGHATELYPLGTLARTNT